MRFPKLRWQYILMYIVFLSFTNINAQVGINTDTPANGALLDINSSDKGFLMTRVALLATDNTSPITPSPTTGLLVYNTVTSGSGATQVTPGFYYWSGVNWRRFFNQGFTLFYNQQSQVRANNSVNTPVDIPDLDTTEITFPFPGTYQILANAFYAAGDNTSTNSDGAVQGGISLQMSVNGGAFTKLKETYFTSSSKRINGTNVNNLAQNITIIYNIDIDVNNTYRFKMVGEEWLRNSAERGWFGKNTNGYTNSTTNDAQRGSMTISLIKQN